MAETGIDISALRSQMLTVDLINSAAHIFTMSVQQARLCAALVPSGSGCVRLFGAFAPASVGEAGRADPGAGPSTLLEVSDPMGGTHEEYVHCLRRLQRGADKCAAWLLDGADETQAPPSLGDSYSRSP